MRPVSPLVECPRCRRHHLSSEAECPFCERAAPARRPLGAAMMAVLTPVVLAACYGAPPIDDTGLDSGDSTVDLDDDGYTADEDCDDSDANVNPGAAEVCDDTIDNDCDDLIDAKDDDCP